MDYLNRKLGLLEKWMDIGHDLGGGLIVNVARIEGLITPGILQQALNFVQKLHPMLQVHIIESEDGLYFESKGTLEIPLRVIDKQHENQWIEIAQDELHEKFSNGTAPLCRVTFVRPSTICSISEIISTFHHAITDGLSCMRFIDDLLSYCQQIASGDRIPEVVTMQLLPPLEDMLDNSLVSKNNVGNTQEISEIEIQTPTLIIEHEAPRNDRHTRLVPRILSQEMTIRLISRCKHEKTTVHGAVCAAMLFAAAKIVFTDVPIHLSCGSAINLRKYCVPEVNDRYMGCLISVVAENHTLEKNTQFWDLARECKSKISHSLNRGTHINLLKNDRVKTIDKEFIIQRILEKEKTMGRNNTLAVSNRGKFNLLYKDSYFQLKELYFATGQHVGGDCFWLGVLTLHEQLFCTFVHVIPLVSPKTAELFADSVVLTLQQACLSKYTALNLLE